MSKVQKIEAAIRDLNASERAELIVLLPQIIPEINGDAEWDRILQSDKPRASFSRYLDEVEAGLASSSLTLRETSDEELKREA